METPKIVLAFGKYIRYFNKCYSATIYMSSSVTFVLEYKVQSRSYWEISNVAIWAIEMLKTVDTIIFKVSGTSYKFKNVFWDMPSQNMWRPIYEIK